MLQSLFFVLRILITDLISLKQLVIIDCTFSGSTSRHFHRHDAKSTIYSWGCH
ncbi:Uncharacterised protein [Vibrio cholerae]|nr:Uncharacterised protein [Vibrio cholerae]